MLEFIIEDVHNNKMYYFSGVKSSGETITSVVTQYTTFTGTKISDNAYLSPKTLEFQLLTSAVAMVPQKEFDSTTNSFRRQHRAEALTSVTCPSFPFTSLLCLSFISLLAFES